MRKSRESRWTCKTPSELLRCSSVGKAAAQPAEPDQESSAAVSVARRMNRERDTLVAKGRLVFFLPREYHPRASSK